MGTNSELMDFMNEELFKITNKKCNFTGKSLKCGGCNGRTEATGYGIVEILKNWALINEINLSNKTYCLQGFGNVGMHTAIYLDKLNLKLIAVGDHTCYIKNKNGFNISKLVDYVKKNRCLKNFSKNIISKKDFFQIKCNIMIPAALELQITKENANNICCDLILEAANGPIDYEADIILNSKNIDILPDILTNSGGVIVSYYEYLQNKSNTNESKEIILQKLANKMKFTFSKVYNLKLKKNISYRNASYGVALKNIEKTLL